MADSHLQLNADGTTATRKTTLWPSSKPLQQEIIKSIFEQQNWHVTSINNVNGSHWKIETECGDFSWKINLFISSIRDESRQPDEFKMQLGNTYPEREEDGWVNLVLGIYTVDDGVHPIEYILSGYAIDQYNFSSNPSIRGTRTAGLQKAKVFGMYATDKSVLFRPEFLYYYIESQNGKQIQDGLEQDEEVTETAVNHNLQQIYYGAPGTGKSHTINEQTEGKSVIRTTFHPDSDYSTFVGAYKPTTKEVPIRDVTGKVVTELNAETGKVEAVKEDRIVYEFVDQAFLQAYVKAWEKYAEAGKNSFNGLVLNNVNGKVYELISIDEDSIYYYNLTTKAEPSKAYRATIKEKFDGIITVDNVQDAIATYLKGINTTDFEAAWTELSRRIEESAAISSQSKTPQVEPQYLVIEEINRGNCAQIFGDLFQLLDRNQWGFSDYPINADKDMKKQLAKAFKDLTINDAATINGHYKDRDVVKEVLNGDILLLPNNLYIWATMNTSDQSLFPIDSAFKRRWDWQYMPIAQGRDEAGNLMAWTIDVNNKKYSWWSFLEKVNAQIGEATQSEDKKLGFFFCKAVDGVISSETFVGKVVFYLWNDVFKDYGFDGPIFKDADNSELSFNKFYKADLKGNAVVQKDKVEQFLKNLGVEIISTTSGDDPMDEVDEDGNNANTANKDFSKYAINGKGSFSKGKVMQEAMKLYAEKHLEMTAEQVMNTWLAMGVNMPNLVETQTLFEERAAKSKDSRVREKAKEVQLANGETIFVSNQFNPDRIADLISKVNAQDWDIKISKI